MEFKYYVSCLGFENGTRVVRLLNNGSGIAVDHQGRETAIGKLKNCMKFLKRISPENALTLINCRDAEYPRFAISAPKYIDPKPKKKDTQGMKITFTKTSAPEAPKTYPCLMEGEDGRVLLMLNETRALVIKNKNAAHSHRSDTPVGKFIDVGLGLGYTQDAFLADHRQIKGTISLEF